MSKEVVVKSYYNIRYKGYAGAKDKYIATGINDIKKLEFTDDRSKALRYEYFGLKGMEKSLSIIMSHLARLNESGLDGSFTITGGDVFKKLDDIEDFETRRNFRLWDTVTGQDAIDFIIEISKDEDGEPTEDIVTVTKFLYHIKRIDFDKIAEVAVNWHLLNELDQSKLAIGYAGEYSASRFVMYMDYLNQII